MLLKRPLWCTHPALSLCASRSARNVPIYAQNPPPAIRVEHQVAKPSIIGLWLHFRAGCSNSTARFSAACTPQYSSSTGIFPVRITCSILANSSPANGASSEAERRNCLPNAPAPFRLSAGIGAPGRRRPPRPFGAASSRLARGHGERRPRSATPRRSRIPHRRRRRQPGLVPLRSAD